MPRTQNTDANTTTLRDHRLLIRFTVLAMASVAVSLLTSWFVASAAAKTGAHHPAGTAVVKVAKTNLGPALVDAKGHTLYLLTADTRAKGKSVCYGACAEAWPPVLTTRKPIAGPGVKAALLGVAKRTDGTKQVTYKGHRLYLFVKDTAPRQTNGQALKGFGGPFCTATLATKPCIWYALSPSGVAKTAQR